MFVFGIEMEKIICYYNTRTCVHIRNGGGFLKEKDYKVLIIELLESADKMQLRRIYHFIKGFLGPG